MLLLAPSSDIRDETIGRAPLLGYLAARLDVAARTRAIVLHGEAGAGKSCIVAELAAEWQRDGGIVEEVGVDAPSAADPARRRLLVVDPDGALPSPAVWRALLTRMGARDRLVVAARLPVRLPLDDRRMVEVRVDPLGWDDATTVLRREGVPAPARPALIRWSRGLPLLLVLGAHAILRHPGWDPGSESEPDALAELLERRLGPSGGELDEDALRAAADEAIRSYRSAERLEDNALAEGDTPAERIASVRARVDLAVERAFGPSQGDGKLLEVLHAGYLVASAAHEQLADELFLSRSTYFRRLRVSLRRATEQLVADALVTPPRASERGRCAIGC